jgi:hypothetical protein
MTPLRRRMTEDMQVRNFSPTTKPRDSALRAVTKVLVGTHVLLTRSLFVCDILRRFLRRVSLVKPTSAALQS